MVAMLGVLCEGDAEVQIEYVRWRVRVVLWINLISSHRTYLLELVCYVLS